MSALALLLEHVEAFEGTLTLSGMAIDTPQGRIQLPGQMRVSATKTNGKLVINLDPGPTASKRFLGIPVGGMVNPITIGEAGVTAKLGPKTIKIMEANE